MALTPEPVAKYRYDGYLYPVPALSADELATCNAGNCITPRSALNTA
jgi:hypothetical protein